MERSMNADRASMEAVLERLEKLERQNRRLRLAGIALLLSGGAVAVMGQAARSPRTVAVAVEARKFVLRDAKGKKRAELGLFLDKPALVLYDEAERATASLGTFQDITGWALFGAREQRLAVLEATPGGPNLSLYSVEGARRLNIGVLAQGPVLGLLA